MHRRFTRRKPGIVFSGRLHGPTNVTPIVAARMVEDGGIICESVIFTMSSVFKQ